MTRRGRRDQQRVTTAHHVRDLPQASKQTQKQRRAAAALSPKMVAAAYQEHLSGVSLYKIVRSRWKEWGCESQAEADKLLRARLHENGFAVRGPGRPESSGISRGRAPSRIAAVAAFTQRARAEYAARKEAEIAAALENPEIAGLVASQEQDERLSHYVPRSFRLISLDVLASFDDSEGESAAEREAVRFARRRGDFRAEAPWVPAAIARVDAEARRRAVA